VPCLFAGELMKFVENTPGGRKTVSLAAALALIITMMASAQAPIVQQSSVIGNPPRPDISDGFTAPERKATAVHSNVPANQVIAPAPHISQARRPVTIVRTPDVHPFAEQKPQSFWQRHPMVKGAAIGGGIGAGAGAFTGLITGQGIIRGAAIGACTGAGVGVVRTSKVLKRHPIIRDVATGGLSGLGLGWAGSHSRGATLATTGVGSAIGLGAGLLGNIK
jgi:hypothetical protein